MVNLKQLLWYFTRTVSSSAPSWLNRFPIIKSIHNRLTNQITERGVWVAFADYEILLDPQEKVYRNLIQNQDPEPKVSKIINRNLTKGDIVIDIGSRYGVQTLQMRQQVGQSGMVYSIDVFPKHCEFLNKTILKNGFENVEVMHAAVSDMPGVVALQIPEGSSSSISILPKETESKDERVQSIALGPFLDEINQPEVDFIKIDVEGAELDVINGLGEELESVSSMVIEVHSTMLSGTQLKELFEILHQKGELFDPQGKEVVSIDNLESSRQIMWINTTSDN